MTLLDLDRLFRLIGLNLTNMPRRRRGLLQFKHLRPCTTSTLGRGHHVTLHLHVLELQGPGKRADPEASFMACSCPTSFSYSLPYDGV
jgi:hypothetical protein